MPGPRQGLHFFGQHGLNDQFLFNIRDNPLPRLGGLGPSRTSMLSAIFPMVALMPQVCMAGLSARNRANKSSHCTALLLPINSCHSSKTTAVGT